MSDAGPREVEEEEVGCWRKFGNWFKYKDKGKWLKEMKGSLSMTASIIATMTFQLATNPPGGVIQASVDDKGVTNCTTDACSAGISIMALLYPNTYRQFLVCNTISFFASISICLMLVSGIPLNHRLPTWLLSIGMCVAISALGWTYILATLMVTPNSVSDTFYDVFNIALYVWLSLLGFVGLFLFIRLCVWVVNIIKKQLN